MIGGEIQETSKKNVLKAIQAQDLLQEVRCWRCEHNINADVVSIKDILIL